MWRGLNRSDFGRVKSADRDERRSRSRHCRRDRGDDEEGVEPPDVESARGRHEARRDQERIAGKEEATSRPVSVKTIPKRTR